MSPEPTQAVLAAEAATAAKIAEELARNLRLPAPHNRPRHHAEALYMALPRLAAAYAVLLRSEDAQHHIAEQNAAAALVQRMVDTGPTPEAIEELRGAADDGN